ncbi:MAG: 30S ribosomal protein S4 [Patescibacteria group bacterium]|nr:30S ribosomal protein S4 [Patescibacteria group bacterium]
MRPKITAKQVRREGINLSGTDKMERILAKKPYPPGEHGQGRRRRMTDYGIQLREKQRAKLIFGVSERQFRNYFESAKKAKGDTAARLVNLLESRLDNAIYRAGFAKTRAAARQLVSHANFEQNGKKANIPSMQIKPGDIISVRESKSSNKYWQDLRANPLNTQIPSWLAADLKSLSIKITSEPTIEELKQPFDPRLIVEFYSR